MFRLLGGLFSTRVKSAALIVEVRTFSLAVCTGRRKSIEYWKHRFEHRVPSDVLKVCYQTPNVHLGKLRRLACVGVKGFHPWCTEISVQTTASDLVQISPEDVEKPGGESIQDNINAKYANKVNGLPLGNLNGIANNIPGNTEDWALHMCLRCIECL